MSKKRKKNTDPREFYYGINKVYPFSSLTHNGMPVRIEGEVGMVGFIPMFRDIESVIAFGACDPSQVFKVERLDTV